ncbi:Na+/H+ antiporter NhaC [Basilea psittacipulmonis]|uniref:Sodium:proton antiporter n=1 Tax=Basilea psittacipulmonis DSM 24701 TaxID=1072685 RepID=A0A077DFK9_9BURK|nr:Na+/H+ antiporter NhaC [Basilea psittacipulmonis]AIL32147.1 sodium:proton antiporter [Basilea psittacipulmonis DSM 24701]
MTYLNNPGALYDDEPSQLTPSQSFFINVLPLLLTVAIMLVQFFIFDDFTPHIPLACGIVITGLFVYFRKGKWRDMENHFLKVIKIGLPAIIILMGVGMLIATWIAAGTVSTILYYGFHFFSPTNFLFTLCLLCALISLATGTSWGTAGTVGLAMMGVGEGLGIPPHVTAGAIISGAFFGDKMSPLSDTTNLTPAAAEIGIWEHIKGMVPTTLPALVICLIFYAWLGTQYSNDNMNLQVIHDVKETIKTHYNISLITLIPAVIVIVAAVMKMPALPTVFAGVIVAGLIALFLQGVSVAELFHVLQNGVNSQTGMPLVDKLLSKGGVMSMTWVVSLTIFAMAFVGSIEYYGSLNAIMNKVKDFIKGRFGLVSSAYGATAGSSLIIGDVYTSLVLPGRLLKDKYEELGYEKTILTRSIEDCGTLLSPLIPWNMGGAFIAATLGVATFDYVPFAVLCWLSPLIGLIYMFLGVFMPKSKGRQSKEKIAKWEGL